MKKYLFLMFGAALFFTACKDKETDPVLQLGAAPAFTSPAGGTQYVLVDSTSDAIFANFTWTAAEYGFDAAVSYTLELDVAGNNFAAPVTVGAVNKLALTNITNGKINNILLAKNLDGEVEHDIEFRIAAKVSPEVPIVYSQPITLKITPFTEVVNYPQLQVPGSYQGWDPANNTTIIFSVRSDDKYEGYINFPAGAEFKYTVGPSWSLNYGDNGGDGSLDKDGANIPITDAGVYKLNVDLNALTHTYTKTDWGLIGSATADGWNSDQNMTYDEANNKWTITTNLVAGEIKFRANDDWGINFGDDGGDKKLEYGGANIAVAEAGNYTIELLLGAAVYRYKITKN